MGAIRLFLALVVAANHFMNEVLWPAGAHMSMRLLFGFNAGYAVMFFYVISGFLITYTLTENYEPGRGGVAAFYRNRLIRIFSVYWPLAAVAFYVGFRPDGVGDALTSVFLLGADWRLMFASYPAEHWSALPANLHQAWTLAPELCFYLAAPWLMRSERAAVALLIASFACRAGIGLLGSPDLRWVYLFAPSTFGFFMLGHLAARAARRWPILAHRRVGFILLAVSFLTMALLRPTDAFDTPRLWISILAFAVALPSIFAATKDSVFLNAMGALSYPLYLTHEFTKGYTHTYFLAAIPIDHPIISVAAFCAVCVVVAIATHLLIERPVSAIARGSLQITRRIKGKTIEGGIIG